MNLRDTAYGILLEVEKRDCYVSELLDTALRRMQFEDKRDRAYITRLVEGVTEHRITLDFVIRKFSKTPFEKLKPEILTILRIGCYELIYMDNVPDRAAVNEAAALTKLHKLGSLTGFVNAVLRAVEKAKSEDRLKGMLLGSPSVRYSIPDWLYKRLVSWYGKEKTALILSDQFSDRKTCIRVNTCLTTPEKLTEQFEKAGVKVEQSKLSENVLKISGYDFIRKLPGYSRGEFSVQDESSACALERLGITKGSRVLDMCAAPGGKSLYAYQLTGGEGCIISRDISDDKIELIKENADRLRADREHFIVEKKDALELSPEEDESYDFVIADVPCSGLGVMSHKNDIKYHVTEESLTELKNQGYRILENAAHFVKKDGRLMYSTCTINPGENEENVHEFAQKNGWAVREERTFLQGIDEGDGFYYAILERT